MHVGFGSYPIEDLHRDLDNSSCPDCKKLGKELSELESDLSALEQETKGESAITTDEICFRCQQRNCGSCAIYEAKCTTTIRFPQSPELREEKDIVMELLVFLGKEGYLNPNTTISYCNMMQRYLNSKSGK